MSGQPGVRVPSVVQATNRGRVNVPGMAGAVWWPLFDFQALSATAASQQTFFSVPIGSGGKTATDTNMKLSGQIPAGQRFFCTGVGLDIFPGVDPVQASAAAGTAAVNEFANDIYAVLQTGRLKFTIGSKDYCDHAPLMRFPSVNRLDVQSSAATTVAATTMLANYAAGAGAHFPMIETTLEANQNFSVTLYDLPALPSGQDGVIGVSLYGWLARNAQ